MSLILHELIAGTEAGPHVLITGGVHGDEFEPMAAARQLIAELRGSLRQGRVTLVPVVNEPAFRRGQRTAEDGLDLARTCPGKPDGRITERIAAELSELIRGADYYIDLHTGGTRLQVLPLAGYVLHPAPRVLAAQRTMANLMNLPLVWGTDPSLDGRSLSVARDAGVPAIYAEYRGGGQTDSVGVAAYVAGCRNILAWLEMIDGSVGDVREPLVVEDSRPGAGHMQVNHPVPCEGFFTPAVSLGVWVEAGDLLGTVCDILGQRVQEVRARYAGVVIVLHTFARIDAGTSIGVVLEVPKEDAARLERM